MLERSAFENAWLVVELSPPGPRTSLLYGSSMGCCCALDRVSDETTYESEFVKDGIDAIVPTSVFDFLVRKLTVNSYLEM